MIPPWASLQRVAVPALFVCVVCVAAMESAASSKRSLTLQKNTRATNHAIAAVELLSQLGCQRIIAWSDADVRLAVLVKALSGRPDLSLHSVRLGQLRQHRWRPGLAVMPTEHHLREWSTAAILDDVHRCLTNPMELLRQQAQIFLVESYVAEIVHRLNLGGLLVPSVRILQLFLRCLQYVPLSMECSKLLVQLGEAQAAKRWSRNFRQRWSFAWGSDSVPHSITQNEIKHRAAIFLRWMRHVLRDRLSGKPAVVVNMDETFLNNIKPWKKGVVLRRADAEQRHEGDIRHDPKMGRTSLLASVCSHAEVQHVFPQIRLPRGRLGKLPSEPLRQAYHSAGAPQEAVHGTSGWNTSLTMKYYLKSLNRAVKRGAPGHAAVLVMDCCPSHLAADVLTYAQRLGVQVVIIPARLTWLMQPLDTHVFAQLKRRIRIAEYDWKACRDDRRMNQVARIEVHSAAIREVLVNGDWSRTLDRAGLTLTAAPLRGKLAEAVANQDLTPRAPTVAELADLFNESEERATTLRRLLLPTLAVPRATQDGASASASGVPAAAMSAVGEPAARQQPLVLLSLRRLPSRPAIEEAGRNLWLPVPSRRPQTRSMTAAATAAAAPGTHASSSMAAPTGKRPRR